MNTDNGENTRHESADRRRSARFSLGLPAQCRFFEDNRDRTAIGQVENISSRGLLFKSGENLLPGQLVTAFIEWPAYLDKRVQLQLVVEGRVVRKTGFGCAILIEKHQFRTRGIGVAAADLQPRLLQGNGSKRRMFSLGLASAARMAV